MKCILASCCTLVCALVPVISANAADRLTAPLGEGKSVVLRGTRSPRIDRPADEGALAASDRISGLGFRFKPTAEQSAELELLLQEEQNPASTQYHAWLTPEEYADRFGLSPNDLVRVAEWLESQGFQIDATARSRTWIRFIATADQVRRAFCSELHRFHVDGQPRFANITEAQVPAELAPLIYNVQGLADLRAAGGHGPKPMATLDDGTHLLTPGDLAAIYNVKPLTDQGFDGAGQKIAVIGESAIDPADIHQFRKTFALPENDPQLILAPGSPDPGVTGLYLEGVSDVEIAGGSAPRASILYVYSVHAWDAAEYAVDQNLAPVITYSYYGCEAATASSPSDLDAGRAVVKQANAQGITWIACSGDSGPAACDPSFLDGAAQRGVWVALPAAFPEITAVGGTIFDDTGGDYWLADGTLTTTARSYPPEAGWNETPLDEGLGASGGGVSVLIAKPEWQNVPGVPKFNGRYVPDLAFAAAREHDPCVIFAQGGLWKWGGTSASAPFFAAMVAILNQYLANSGIEPRPGLGNMCASRSSFLKRSRTWGFFAISGFRTLTASTSLVSWSRTL
jgi:subtilase family serine protease